MGGGAGESRGGGGGRKQSRSAEWLLESVWLGRVQTTWTQIGNFWWRLLELHMIKLLCCMGMLVSVRDVSRLLSCTLHLKGKKTIPIYFMIFSSINESSDMINAASFHTFI